MENLYARTLFPLGHGAANWRPDYNLHIGTVALRLNGSFSPLFHIEYPNNTAAMGTRLQLDVLSFTLGSGATLADSARLTKQYLSPGIVARGVTAVAEHDAAAVEAQLVREHTWDNPPHYALSCKLESCYVPPSQSHAGALLHLPSGADRNELPVRSAERRAVIAHMKANHQKWCEKLVTEMGYYVRPEELLVVLGHVKTNAWTVVSWSGEQTKRQNMVLNLLHMTHRHRTPNTAWRDPQSFSGPFLNGVTTGKAPVNGDFTQPVFLSYVKIKYRTRPKRKREILERVGCPVDVDKGWVMTATGVDLRESVMDPVELVLDYLLKKSKAKAAIATDADVIDLFRGKPWPEDICRYLEKSLPAYAVGGDFAYLVDSECA